MVGTSKLLMLLTSPFHLLGSRPSVFRLTRHPRIAINTISSFSKRSYSSSSTTRPLLRCSINPTSRNIHAQTDGVSKEDFQDVPNEFATDSRASHPWPEWSKLVDNLRVSGHFDQRKFSSTTSLEQLDWEDTFSMFENMSEEFLQAANACLAFARARPDLLGSLSRKDIETVVEHGHPFLFKASADSMERMQSFLGSGSGTESLFKADTVDLMRFLVSYAHNPSAARGGRTVGNEQLLESAVRNLLSELVDASTGVQGSNLASELGDSSTGVHRSNPAGEIVDERFSTPHQSPDGYGQMTRAPRQNIEMKRGDWICSRCQFMNFARNIKCLECNEARPRRQLTGGEWECPQCDFFNYGRNVVCLRCDCRRPGEASYGTAESKSRMGHSDQGNVGRADFANLGTVPPQQRLANEQFRGNFSNDGALQGNNFQSVEGASPGKSSGTSINQSLDRILSRSSTSETNYNAAAAGENYSGIKSSARLGSSPQFSQTNGIKSDYVPFVPLPTDMFAKSQKDSKELVGNNDSIEQKSAVTGKASDSFSLSEKPVNETESKEEAEKSERWFKKVSELHDVADLTSAISDEDFPEIMPMRKGENRFVVSKKKDRSLTSPLHKRRMAMEQTNSNNFVPFVPFPPDYFAKKDKAPETGAVSAKQEMHSMPQKSDEHNVRLPTSGSIRNSPQPAYNQPTNEGKWSTFSGNSMNENKANYSYPGNSDQRLNNLGNTGGESWNSGSWNDKRSDTASPTGSLAQSVNTNDTKESWKGGFTGKSLEGSLVKEPDPLDMSEEAKAERWFRRAAQIKDISELSQIPDEDFPQIMPMRKGVNRFVVSKRKTPLERRLTSPQYRRNLPIISSEPPKKENNDS